MSKFQFILIGVFIVFIIAGVVAFATYKGSDNSNSLPGVTIWGTFPKETFDLYVAKINNDLQQTITVNYAQKKPEQFGSDFISALARGTGPDAILIPADMILPHQDKLTLIPYEALPAAAYRASFIQEADLYLSQKGILALPFTVDPLIMYWNRDTFDSAGIATYPRNWDEFERLNKLLTEKDQNGNIRKSAVAMGQMSNIANSRELLGSLFLQAGNPITIVNSDGFSETTLSIAYPVNPVKTLEFFTQFVNPSSPNYSWNRGMPNSKTAFLSGMLATYFGFASELKDIRAKNPNLNFDAAPLPQMRAGVQKAAYGRMYGMSIVRISQNPNAVFQVMSILTAPQNLAALSEEMYLPTVRRDVIAQESPSDPFMGIFNASALISRSWLDADPNQSRIIFTDLTESVSSGQKSTYEAVNDAGDRYDLILRQATEQ